MSTPEHKVKEAIKGWLKKNGAYQFWPVQTGWGAATVDALVCINGRFIAIETKAPGITKPTPRQRIVMDVVEAAGGWAFCADSLEEFLRQYAHRTGLLKYLNEANALADAAKKRSPGPGRPRIHETNGLRQAAYRDRLKLRGHSADDGNDE